MRLVTWEFDADEYVESRYDMILVTDIITALGYNKNWNFITRRVHFVLFAAPMVDLGE